MKHGGDEAVKSVRSAMPDVNVAEMQASDRLKIVLNKEKASKSCKKELDDWKRI